MAVVDVRVHPEEALEDGLHSLPKAGGERLARLLREHSAVVQLGLHPLHQVQHVPVLRVNGQLGGAKTRAHTGAEHSSGFFTFTPSAQRYSYLGPAHMVGHDSAVQLSLSVPGGAPSTPARALRRRALLAP